jgi:hypothetical protein
MYRAYRLITVAREYASGGGAIAKRVAERLNWRLLDKNLISGVARTAQVDIATADRYDESVDSWWRRMYRNGLWSAALAGGAIRRTSSSSTQTRRPLLPPDSLRMPPRRVIA